VNKSRDEKRKYERYDSGLKIYFDFCYDVETKVKYQLVDRYKGKLLPQKYSAIGHNVSAQGLSFTSRKKLKKNDSLSLEIYLPTAQKPVHMQGQVRWSRKAPSTITKTESKDIYLSGIQLTSVDEKSVTKSIYFDEDYQVTWSIVLESVFGNFRILAMKKLKS